MRPNARRDSEHNPNSKLNWAKVDEIHEHRSRGLSLQAIAYEFDVSHTAISNVLKGRTWPRK